MNARPALILKAFLAIACLAASLFLTSSKVQAAAGGIQNCTVSTTCVIGEFLYNDDSTPLTSATCTVTSKDPSGNNFLNSQSMTGQSDGWYAYSFTAPTTTGLYRTFVQCTASGDTVKIDKTFEVKEASTTDPTTIASAVWSYSSRTISSFGTIISDFWNNTTRTLTGTGLSSGQLATQSDVISVRDQVTNTTNINASTAAQINNINNITNEIRLELEKVVNAPIIENVLEDNPGNLSEKIKDTRSIANQVYVNNQYLLSQSARLGADWNKKDGRELFTIAMGIAEVLGEEGDSASSNTIFGQVNWLRDSWNWEVGDSIYKELVEAKKLTNDIKLALSDYDKSSSQAQAKVLVKKFIATEKLIGKVSDQNTASTLFAKIETTSALALKLDERGEEVDRVLGEYARGGQLSTAQVLEIQNRVLAVNKIPKASKVLAKLIPNDPVSIKNVLLGIRGLINSNKKFLAGASNKTLVNVWLEVGSVIFKTMATNPSTLISQDVNIKYYLPKEIREEFIIKTDPGLTVKYDAEKDQYYVEGVFTLAPGETRAWSIETKDIWEVTPDEIASLRKQAEELYKPLEKTAYYAQGVTLKSDIDASLDKIAAIQAAAVTPEDKIRSYREADLLRESVEQKISGMKDLVTQASATGNLFGFVGGAQTIAVWGLIVIIAAGFIFMATYMRTITAKAASKRSEPVKHVASGGRGMHPLKFIGVIVVTSTISASVTGYIMNRVVSKTYEEKLRVLGTQAQEAQPTVTPAPTTLINSDNLTQKEIKLTDMDAGTGGQYTVVVGDTPTGYLNVRNSPKGRIVAKAFPGDILIYLGEDTEWFKVELEDGTEGWVAKTYTTKE